jgi:predicted ATPase
MARLDAEDWRNVVNAYLDAASGAVISLGGHVLKRLGDGLMALFGYPHAQENDAERAVRAALAIQRALSELNARNAASGMPELAARIGIDAGPVVVDAGDGQFALVVGEPGIGKSRIIEEFRSRLGETLHTWVEWSASQLLQNTPLHPITEWGRLRFSADAPAERLADLEDTLRLVGLDPAEYTPLVAPLVDIPLPRGRALTLSPVEMRPRQLAAMTAWVLAGARSQPAALAFEDLNWADPTMLDLLRVLAERGAQAPLFILATTRPEFRPPRNLRSHHSVVSLAPLDRMQVRRMVEEITARSALPLDVVEIVSERTGGVPLFVEEVTRLLLERSEEGAAQAIPPTLQQSLAARLDRLGEAREIAQIGPVLGRDFSYTPLREVAELAGSTLQVSLDRLADADLLFVEGAPPDASASNTR